MDAFAGKVAIVTGGASGIGRAVGTELARRGARVVFADINLDAAHAAAQAVGGTTVGVQLDVADASAVERVVQDVAGEHGRLDLMFNNAGVFIGGDARLMSLEHWRRIVDVNIRGVVHGVLAAYPIMIRQGFGHIVNTASAAGLVPTPGGTAYAMTKHAVVGLSTSLRCEAAGLGVKVSVVCPGLIDTPIVHTSELLNVDRDAVMRDLPVRLYPAEACARDILVGVSRNQAIIVVTRMAKGGWLLYRLFPSLMTRVSQRLMERSPLLRRAG